MSKKTSSSSSKTPVSSSSSSSSTAAAADTCKDCGTPLTDDSCIRCSRCAKRHADREEALVATRAIIAEKKEKKTDKSKEKAADSKAVAPKKGDEKSTTTQKLSAADADALPTEPKTTAATDSPKRRTKTVKRKDEEAPAAAAAPVSAPVPPKKKQTAASKAAAREDADKSVCTVEKKFRFPEDMPKDMAGLDEEVTNRRKALWYEFYCRVPNIGNQCYQYWMKVTKGKAPEWATVDKREWQKKFETRLMAATENVTEWVDECSFMDYETAQLVDMINAKWPHGCPNYIRKCEHFKDVEWPKADKKVAAANPAKPVSIKDIQDGTRKSTGRNLLVLDKDDPKFFVQLISAGCQRYAPMTNVKDDEKTLAEKKKIVDNAEKQFAADMANKYVDHLYSSILAMVGVSPPKKADDEPAKAAKKDDDKVADAVSDDDDEPITKVVETSRKRKPEAPAAAAAPASPQKKQKTVAAAAAAADDDDDEKNGDDDDGADDTDEPAAADNA